MSFYQQTFEWLKINLDKTEAIWIGSKHLKNQLTVFSREKNLKDLYISLSMSFLMLDRKV
jgi:hypothetical protein